MSDESDDKWQGFSIDMPHRANGEATVTFSPRNPKGVTGTKKAEPGPHVIVTDRDEPTLIRYVDSEVATNFRREDFIAKAVEVVKTLRRTEGIGTIKKAES